ncbi:MAG: YicC family protein [Alphaproteobacteria bacterium]|nr:YicC family protein [Alphaproteobacteria bacterium]
MPLSSMTGFARTQGSQGPWRWHWEVRSVNARGLDVRLRFPEGFEGLEQPARILANERFSRGSVTGTLTLDADPAKGAIRVNADALQQVVAALKQLEGKIEAEPPRLDGILALRGVLDTQPLTMSEAELAARDAAVLGSLAVALDALKAARRDEGGRLDAILRQHTQRMENLVADAERLAATQPEQMRARLRTSIEEVLKARPGLNEDRLAQEIALLLAKADVREEIDRLKSHLTQARNLFADGGAQGRRLDFLAQELNREANTLCSKSSDIQLTRIGLEMKATIDQLREQVQNVE